MSGNQRVVLRYRLLGIAARQSPNRNHVGESHHHQRRIVNRCWNVWLRHGNGWGGRHDRRNVNGAAEAPPLAAAEFGGVLSGGTESVATPGSWGATGFTLGQR